MKKNEKDTEKENEEEKDHVTPHQILAALNTYGSFQTKSLALLCPTFFYLGLYLMSPVLLNITPAHKCSPASSNNTCYTENMSLEDFNEVCNVSNIRSFNCYRYKTLNANETQDYNRSENWIKETCSDGWMYSREFGNTVISEFDLVCDSSWKKPILVASWMAGMMIGSLFGGRLSDRFGRKTLSISCCFSLTISLLVSSFSPSFWFYTSVVFFSGLFQVLVYLCSFIWVQEIFSGSSKRNMAAVCVNVIYGMGSMSSSIMGFYFKDWKWICRCYAILGFLICCIMSTVSESLIWLSHSNKKKATTQALKRLAKWNKIDTDKGDLLTKFDTKSPDQCNKDEDVEKVPLSILRTNKVLFRRIIIISYLWNNGYLGFFTMAYNVSNLGGNAYYNNLIGGGVDVGAALFMAMMLKKFSAKKSLIFFYGVFSCLSTLCPLIRQANDTAGLICAMLGRFFASSGVLLTIFYTGEIFPTLLRNSAYGIASMTSRIGTISAPFLIFAGEELNLSIPFYVMGGVSLLAAILTLFLPNVSKSSLPDTIKDALALDDGFRCCSNKETKKTNELL